MKHLGHAIVTLAFAWGATLASLDHFVGARCKILVQLSPPNLAHGHDGGGVRPEGSLVVSSPQVSTS